MSHQVSQDGCIQVHPGAVAEEAVGRGCDALPPEGSLLAVLPAVRYTGLRAQTKCGGWAIRPSKVMSCTGFASTVVAESAQFPRVALTAGLSILVILIDPLHEAIKRNPDTQWITKPVHKHREMRFGHFLL
ncbi:hypothetical protein U0070_009107 [Myodes glareolus]|uniref:Ribosomal protein L15 n=1 Tax=Myodes glareolus TaxID=447135 RepID=A0AAW0HUR6_MYOGA